MGKRLVVTGMDFFAPVLVGNINRYGDGWKASHVGYRNTWVGKTRWFWELAKADGVIFLGGCVRPGRSQCLLSLLSRFRRQRILMYWTGSDVLAALEEQKKSNNLNTFPKEIVHIAAAPWLVDELGGFGIQAMFISLSAVPFVRVDLSAEAPPLPRDFTILTYVPDNSVLLYGGEYIKRLARDFPRSKIKILASSGKWWPDHPPGVEFLGWVDDPRELYIQSTVLVRMTGHDAVGGMVQEALSYGRHVIWSYFLDGVRTARDYAAMRGHIQELMKIHRHSELRINAEGIETVKNKFLPALNIKRLLEVMDNQAIK